MSIRAFSFDAIVKYRIAVNDPSLHYEGQHNTIHSQFATHVYTCVYVLCIITFSNFVNTLRVSLSKFVLCSFTVSFSCTCLHRLVPILLYRLCSPTFDICCVGYLCRMLVLDTFSTAHWIINASFDTWCLTLTIAWPST